MGGWKLEGTYVYYFLFKKLQVYLININLSI
jgi:hypothetical protein